MTAIRKATAGMMAVLALCGHAVRAGEEAPKTERPPAGEVPGGVMIDAVTHIDLSKGHCGIQDAIDAAAAAGGGTVILPEGRFVLNRYLYLHSNVTLKGQGEKTVLVMHERSGSTKLKDDTQPGDKTIRVENPEMLGPDQGLRFEGPGAPWNHDFNAVVKVEGDLLTLERPVAVSAKAGDEVLLQYNMITGDQVKNVVIEDLRIEGAESRFAEKISAGFRQAGIHFNRTENLTIRNVTVTGWFGDGFSMQGQKNFIVDNCRAIRNNNHGFHPGTGVDGGEITNCLAENNTATGVFYCWWNKRVNVRNCRIIGNGRAGVGRLGNPGDHNNIVENNVIAGNGEHGIECAGGGETNNIIRNNTVRDNSRKKPGGYPGIVIAAGRDGAYKFTLENNIVESTLDAPTQWVGIEEVHSIKRPPRPKKGEPPSTELPEVVKLANDNRIVGNTLKGHKTADIIVRGPDTVVEGNIGKVVEERMGLGPLGDR